MQGHMNCLIIGGGYVGKACAQALRQQGHTITVTTTRAEKLNELQAIAHRSLLLKGNDLQAMIAALMGQQIVLLSVAAHSVEDYIDTYLVTAETLAIALQQSSEARQLIYTSSTSVYGEREGEWVSETDTLAPLNAQAMTLCLTEQVLLSKVPSFVKLCIFRLGEIYGAGREIQERLKRMPKKSFPGSGNNYTNLIHLDDVVAAILLAIEKKFSGIYNLCNDFHLPRRELYDQLCQMEGLPKVQWDPSLPSLHGGNKRVSNDKIKREGFIPRSGMPLP